MQTETLCGFCGKPMEGTVAFDPQPRGGPSYVHPECLLPAKEKRQQADNRVRDHAFEMLATLEKVKRYLEVNRQTDKLIYPMVCGAIEAAKKKT